MQDNNKTNKIAVKVKMDKMMLTYVQPHQAQELAQVGDDDFVVRFFNESFQQWFPTRKQIGRAHV